jgi:MFS family permease
MSQELKTGVGDRYNVLAMIFFIGYCIVDIPAAFVVRRVGPALWTGTIGLAWGVVTIGQGFVKHWGQLAVCRVLLGFLEGGLVPAAMFLMSVWYTRYEIQVRIGGFYVIGNASSGLAGLLAYGIEKMAGKDNLEGWSWIFIIVGYIVVPHSAIHSFSNHLNTGRDC